MQKKLYEQMDEEFIFKCFSAKTLNVIFIVEASTKLICIKLIQFWFKYKKKSVNNPGWN
jgi:hypothetical protein